MSARAKQAVEPEAAPPERPILFSAPMVRAILAGTKTQTRRVVTARNSLVNGWPPCMKDDPELISAWPGLRWDDVFVDRGPSPAGNPGPYLKVGGGDQSYQRVYSRIQPGDRLWVRETFGLFDTQPADGPDGAQVFYRATDGGRPDLRYQLWRPSVYMPRWASRITLAVTRVHVERLCSISEADAKAEGVRPLELPMTRPYAAGFGILWDGINGKRPGCSWTDDPWVWAVSFEVAP